jgi:predicted ester cyclase
VIAHEQALDLVRTIIDAGRHRDLSRLMDCYAEDAIALSPVFGEVRGRTNLAASWQKLFTTFSDLRLEVSDVLVDGDRIAILGTVNTVDRLGWFGLPPTGGPIDYRLVLLFTLKDGKIIRDERIYDSAGVLERLEKARLDRELRVAAEVQRTLLSRTAHTAAFCESVGHSEPCRAIGGDFFEFVELPSGDVGIVMGDVAGKGPAAALLAAMLQGMFVSEAAAGEGPAATLSQLNRRLFARHFESRFATLVYAVLSANGRLVYSNGGHNAPALITDAGIQRLTAGGPILGMFDTASFEEETLDLRAGDTVLMFTDGVTEARSSSDEEFGENRLLARLAARAGSSPMALLEDVFGAVRGFCQNADQSDDVTVAVTRFGA